MILQVDLTFVRLQYIEIQLFVQASGASYSSDRWPNFLARLAEGTSRAFTRQNHEMLYLFQLAVV
jgi:hypothetical protein